MFRDEIIFIAAIKLCLKDGWRMYFEEEFEVETFFIVILKFGKFWEKKN